MHTQCHHRVCPIWSTNPTSVPNPTTLDTLSSRADDGSTSVAEQVGPEAEPEHQLALEGLLSIRVWWVALKPQQNTYTVV